MMKSKPCPPIELEEQQRRLDLFDAIAIKHPRLESIKQGTNALRKQTASLVASNEERSANARGRPIKLRELWVLPIIGPSGSTKSTSMQIVIDSIYADPSVGENEIPVLPITVDGNVKGPRQLQVLILEAYGDAAADHLRRSSVGYNPTMVNMAIKKLARKYKTTVLAIDEAHNMLLYDGGKIGKQMADLLKGMVNMGIFSIILLGTADVRKLFTISKELQNRCQVGMDIGLDRLDVKARIERQYFYSFVDRLERKMTETGVIDDKIGLNDSVEAKATVYDMADGVIGVVSRILRLSLMEAMKRGRTFITWNDIEVAFTKYNNLLEKPGFNPFLNGPNAQTLSVISAAAKASESA